jgi:hypothetical protein
MPATAGTPASVALLRHHPRTTIHAGPEVITAQQYTHRWHVAAPRLTRSAPREAAANPPVA